MKNKNVAFHQNKVDVSTSAVEVLPANSGRTYLIIQNLGASNIYLNFSGTAVAGEGLMLKPEESYEPYQVPTNSISVIADASTSIVFVES